jgi:hypothetical protein
MKISSALAAEGTACGNAGSREMALKLCGVLRVTGFFSRLSPCYTSASTELHCHLPSWYALSGVEPE